MIRSTLIALTLASAFGAQAATVVINFSGSFDSGSLIGSPVTGQFSFDDAALNAATTELPLLSLSFSFGGSSYSLAGANAGTTFASFDAGTLLGVNAAYSGGPRTVTLSDGFGSPFLAYAQGSDGGSAALVYAPVPEPTSLALMLGGLVAVGALARRRRTA